MQRIEFRQVLPNPLKDSPLTGNVWTQTLGFERGKKYLVKADSGKGKSTLLNIIYGTRKDFTGTVSFDGNSTEILSSDAYSELRENRLAYLFQDLRLFSQLTALQNIKLKPGCRFSDEEIQLLAEALGVANQLHKPCSKLSLGQQQRIALIRALSHPFEWLLLDEPFSHLDKKNAAITMNLIREFSDKNQAGIIATSLGEDIGFEDFETVLL